MFVEFDALYNFIASNIDLVKDITTDYSVYSFVLTWSNTIYCSTGLINSLSLPIWNIPCSNCSIVRTTDEKIIHYKQIWNSFCMPNKLIQYLSLICKAPFYYHPIFKAAEYSLFGKASRDDFISYLCLLLLFFFLFFTFSLEDSLFFLLFFSFNFFIKKSLYGNLSFRKVPSSDWSVFWDGIEHVTSFSERWK